MSQVQLTGGRVDIVERIWSGGRQGHLKKGKGDSTKRKLGDTKTWGLDHEGKAMVIKLSSVKEITRGKKERWKREVSPFSGAGISVGGEKRAD